MSRKRFVAKVGIVLMSVLCLLLAAVVHAAEGKKVATVTIAPEPELYATELPPLAPNQCGQCHNGAFRSIKTKGARHTFDCQKCHNTFHNYNPKKGNWDEIMPKCASCHAEPHGKAVTDCLNCHANPHAPKEVAMGERLVNACATCHAGPNEDLVKFPSKHSKLGCQRCHSSHGLIPSCFNCHKPHTEDQPLATCTGCHPVHKPTQIAYGKDVPAATCGACHGDVLAKWQKSPSRHAKVACVACHRDRHRFVPKCTECHQSIHNAGILQRYPDCLTCHLDPHDPPVAGGKK